MGDTITLRVPAKKRYALVARMTAKSVATSAGANVFIVDNVHHAIEEVFVQGYAHCRENGFLSFEFTVTDDELITHARASESCDYNPEEFNKELNAVILESFCDECTIEAGDIWALTIRHSLHMQGS